MTRMKKLSGERIECTHGNLEAARPKETLRRVRAAMLGAIVATQALVASAHGGAWSGFGCLPQDLNADGEVNGADLATLLGGWGLPGPADFDGVNGVDGADLASLLGAWGSWPLNDCLEITGVDPSSAAAGEVISVTGHFPDPDREDYCIVSMDANATVVPFEVISVDPGKLKLRVGPYPPEATTGLLMVGLGEGTETIPGDLTPGVGYGATPWSWAANGDGVGSAVEFKPIQVANDIGGTFYGALDGGALKVTISGACGAGTKLRIWPRAHHYSSGPGDPYVGFDCYIPCVEIFPGSDEFTCAQQICSIIENVYAAHVPPISITCSAAPVVGGTELTLKLDGLDISWGCFNIEVLSDDVACGPGPGNCTAACPCDVNGDGQVNEFDLLAIKNSFGACPGLGVFCCADLNGDSEVNFADISVFLACAPCPANCNEECPCDINNDGSVDDVDLAQLVANFGPCPGCCEDLNGDDVVNQADFSAWLACNGSCDACNAACPCDVNNDGTVDQLDLQQIQAAFGACSGLCCEDLNGDGVVNLIDIQIWLACDGSCGPNPCSPDCPCDVNGDGVVDGADLQTIQDNFGVCGGGACCTDLNGDGQTNVADINVWIACGGGCIP